MSTLVIDTFDPIEFLMGAKGVIDYELSPEDSIKLIDRVTDTLKHYWKELPFLEASKVRSDSIFTINEFPEELRKIRLLRVYGGQRFYRDGQYGYVVFFMTKGHKWLRVFVDDNRSTYRLHEWLNVDDMKRVLVEDPSLLRSLVTGIAHKTAVAATLLRSRANMLTSASNRIERLVVRMDDFQQVFERDLPHSTPRLLS